MMTHQLYPKIIMHTDQELADIIGHRIVERKTIHQWPLSCVQRLILDDGTKLVYKSQLPPSVEPCFYEKASSKLLPGYKNLNRLDDCQIMIIEWIDAPLLRDTVRNPNLLAEHGRRVITQIGEIKGDIPVYYDIGTVEAWISFGQAALEQLGMLIRDRRFRLTDLGAVERLQDWAISTGVLEAVSENPRVTHADLKADQVFVTTEGYRVIDWQRPVVAPPEIDLVALLVGEGIDPQRFVPPAVIGVYWFLLLHWAVEAQSRLFPDFRGPLFDQWAADAIINILEN